MTVRTTLSFTDRHHKFMIEQVGEGIYATQSALIADAVEQLIEQRAMRDAALTGMTEEIRRRLETPREEYIPWDSENNPITLALNEIRNRRK
jgi:antitoxin ParD1/3/4